VGGGGVLGETLKKSAGSYAADLKFVHRELLRKRSITPISSQERKEKKNCD